ncbi:asparagine synthase (glutamine-hydrolyzing) [Desulfuromonas carbonis]|uniref:asparagine synthase (glutamine-hydrolyzing) n=1 Tax=Desulfuromonas sp. DDH964 TaxID=1823759 RepID=UPI00078BD236|nr:asparagine synthase (glutamine-hydrolyzing) [Desulfuromonas sp. DDH964]AMV71108.1 asparagine synthetase [Desulfuromonas sp. DDH964]
MCGITGYFALDFATDCRDAAVILPRMAAALVHRGPDGEGYFTGPEVCFGFRRLAIVDLEGGGQPHFNEDGSLVSICNGEIYNEPELRAELLARGHTFRSRSDVEVLVHLYEEYGDNLVDHLRGQFAFALYDRRARRFLAARDQIGICPFYYAIHQGQLLFASEIKALLQYPGFRPAIDPAGLDQILTFPGLASPQTMFQGVKSLPAGQLLRVASGRLEVQEYWDLDYPLAAEPAPSRDPALLCEELLATLTRAVERRLRADVPVGFYLSGGLDSSLVARLIQRLRPADHWDCFSIGFAQAEIDEQAFQELALSGMDARRHLTVFDWQGIASRLPQVIRAAETPLKESYNTCSLALSAMVRDQGYKVVLSGEGADELFGGYVGYRLDRLRRPAPFPTPEQLLEGETRQRLWGDADFYYERDYHAFRELKGALYAPALAAALDTFESTGNPVLNRERLRGRDPFHQRSYIDFKLRIADHLLADHGDRVAMAHSVEGRYPFLDLDLIELVRGIQPRLMIAQGVEKALLKQTATDIVPPAIVNREKFAFVAPGSDYLLRHDRQFVLDYLSFERVKRENYFNPETVERLKEMALEEGFSLNQTFDNDLLMVVLTFSLFLEEYGG